jgi:hypothetical protein
MTGKYLDLFTAKYFGMWWPETGLNRRRRPFQGLLPDSISGLESMYLIENGGFTKFLFRMV